MSALPRISSPDAPLRTIACPAHLLRSSHAAGGGAGTPRRSVSVPALAKERKLATQALMRATEAGDVQALRRLVIEAGAELSGCRALNRLGNDPVALLLSSGHLTQEEQRRIRRQFSELPELAAAKVSAAKAGTTKAVRQFSKVSMASETSAADGPLLTESPANAQSFSVMDGSLKGREQRTQLTLTSLAGSVSTQMHEKVCSAALSDPRLLQMPHVKAGETMPAICRALKSEELALKAITRNPGLLRVDALKFKKVLPVLVGIFGSQEEAAYAVAVQPQLLEVERPLQMKETLRALVGCLCSMKDALWIVVQTLMPPSLLVSARLWCHEDVVGEYCRMEGREVDDRPVYLKPASSMQHLGAKAKDMYLRYFAQGAGGAGCWYFSPTPARKPRYDPRSVSKLACAAMGLRIKEEDRDAAAQAACPRTSPDQVPTGLWSFRSPENSAWTPDPYLLVADGGRPRDPGLLTVQPVQLRQTFDYVKEALGLCWREAAPDGRPPEDVRFVACPVAGGTTHMGGAGRFKDLGRYTQEKHGYSFLQLSMPCKDGAAKSRHLRLQAWEPLCVTLLYCGASEEEAQGEPAEGESQPRGQHHAELGAAGFAVPMAPPALPELEGLPAVREVMCRCFPRGPVELPVPLGPGRLPPLVFFRAQVCGESVRSGTFCEVARTKVGEPLFSVNSKEKTGDTEAPASAGALEMASSASIHATKELGTHGFSFFRTPAADAARETSEAFMRIDSMDRLQVVLVVFRLPSAASACPEGAVQGDEKAGDKAESPAAPPSPPSPPAWVSAQRWQAYESRLVPNIMTQSGQEVCAEQAYERTFEAGKEIIVYGAGADVTSVAFFRQVGEPRADPVRSLLLQQPSLLATGDRVADLLSRLRADLGDELSRRVLVSTKSEWPRLCVAKSDAGVDPWIFKHKVDVMVRELQSREQAQAVLRQPDAAAARAVAKATTPELIERCGALRDVLGGNRSMLDVLSRRPQLLASQASALQSGPRALQAVFDPEAARRVFQQRPEFLVRGPEIAGMLGQLREHFPDIAVGRLQERSSGEWARWPEMVGQRPEALQTWMGRIKAEERVARHLDRPRAPSA